MVRRVVSLILLCGGCSAAGTPPSEMPDLARREPCGLAFATAHPIPPNECPWPRPEFNGSCPEGTHHNGSFGSSAPCEAAGSEPIALSFDQAARKRPASRASGEAASEYFQAGRYQEAEDLFARGYKLSDQHYWFAYGVASSKEQQGHVVAALRLFRAIAVAKPPQGDDEFERVRQKSAAAVTKLEPQVGMLKITLIEDGGPLEDEAPHELTLDSQLVLASVLTAGLVVPAGAHALSFRGRCRPVDFEAIVPEGGTVNVDVALSQLRQPGMKGDTTALTGSLRPARRSRG